MESGKYNIRIELLRIIGITGIIVYHIACLLHGETSFVKLFSFISLRQWIWADVFLALSGYYFYQSFSGKFKNKCLPYFKNRIIRIVPAYYLFLIFYLTIGLKLERLAGNNFILPSKFYWIHFFTFTVNIPLALGNWTGVALEGFFGISMLVQFYLIFGIIFSVVKKQKYRVLIILCFQLLSIFLRSLELFQQDEWMSYFFTFTRIDAFLWGILFCILFNNDKRKSFLYKHRISIFIVSIILSLVIMLPTNFFDVHNIRTLKFGLPFIVLTIFSLLNIMLNNNSSNGSFYSGDYVYGIYLVRLPLIYLVKSFVQSLSLNNSISSYLFIFLSLTVCILWGLIFQIINQFIEKRRLNYTLMSKFRNP